MSVWSLPHSFSRRRHTTLLASLVIVFTLRPLIGNSTIGRLFFSLGLLALLVMALYTVQVDELVGDVKLLMVERRRRGIIAWTLATIATVERIATLVAPSPTLYLTGTVCWLAFAVFVTWNELRAVLRQKAITSETISMAISVYIMLGLAWGLLYIVIYQVQPQAFSLPAISPDSALSQRDASVFPVLIYFSFITLTTIGYGDIAPLSMVSRYAAVAEGVTGQFYIAILVARLVAMQIMSAHLEPSAFSNESSDQEKTR